MADDGFGSGTNDERLGQLLAAADGYNGQFGREAFDVMLFFLDKALRNEQRKGDILMAGGLETAVECLLNVFPERPAVGTHDHAAADRSVIGELRFQDQLVVPLGEIFPASG